VEVCDDGWGVCEESVVGVNGSAIGYSNAAFKIFYIELVLIYNVVNVFLNSSCFVTYNLWSQLFLPPFNACPDGKTSRKVHTMVLGLSSSSMPMVKFAPNLT